MLLLLLKLYAVQGLFVKYERAVGASPTSACTHGQMGVANWPIRARDLLLLCYKTVLLGIRNDLIRSMKRWGHHDGQGRLFEGIHS